MAALELGDIRVDRVIEEEGPSALPSEWFAEATPENLAPLRPWLVPKAICPDTGKMIIPYQSYVIRTRHHTILIDTCYGNDKTLLSDPRWNQRTGGTYLSDLAATGVAPETVDYVFCTHLHLDHCGWNTRLRDGRWVPTFPNAKYLLARREVEHAEHISRSDPDQVYAESVAPILESGQAVLVEMDHALDDQVRLEPTPGHTPGHVAVRFASRGHGAVMCGDLMHSPIQCARPEWSPVFDADQAQARITRRAFLEACVATRDLVMTAHFPSPSIGWIDPDAGAFRFRYIDGGGGA
ncbi:MAG: MBL fold metallo-hydrolase [Alphaproteobacteria bacterium]|nr:MBL fold metallo-hydrolase [Alphaproteobacteria bacterium]